MAMGSRHIHGMGKHASLLSSMEMGVDIVEAIRGLEHMSAPCPNLSDTCHGVEASN
jgi:hypothetical protein